MRLGLNLLVGLAISACALGPKPATEATGAATLAATRVPSPSASTRPTLAPSPTTRACLLQPGRIVSDELLDDDLPRSIPFRVYVPPCYDESSDDLPVLLMLHGLLATDQQWLELGIDKAANGLIARGGAPPFLMVMPWERRGLEFETAVVEHLLPHVQTTYRATDERGRVAIGGLSRGGGWALRIGLNHPEVFGSVGLHSPAVLTPDLYYIPEWVEALPEDQQPRLWIDIGDHDSLRASVFELTDLLTSLGYEHEWRLDPGDHTPEYWSSHLEAYLRWYSKFW
jgi:enterochelin esterase-like enzyme